MKIDATPVTKTELLEILKEYPTKHDLHTEIDITHSVVDIKLEDIKNDLREFKIEMSDFKNRTTNTLDYIVKQLEEMRENRDIKTHHDTQIKKKVDDHEKRIKKLEIN